MRKLIGLIAALGFAVPLIAADPPTAQTRHGQELFLKSPKGIACGTCHEMNGLGRPVGPNLKNISTYAMPHGMVVAIRMSSTETVQLFTTNAGVAFPARVVEKQNGEYKLWNLLQNPPIETTLNEKEVKSIERDQKWKHPPASADYTSAELADIIGFLRWASTGNVKVVTEDEVAYSQ